MSLFAYIDAGTGSMLLQMLAGGVAGIAVMAKLYWRRFKRFITGANRRESDSHA